MELEPFLLIFTSSSAWRRPKAIKNILIGRRTVSNLYWALQYNMLDFFGALHGIDLPDSIPSVAHMRRSGVLQVDENQMVRRTKQGDAKRALLLSEVPDMNDLKWASRFEVRSFMTRFTFLVQVVSEYSYGNAHYYPQTVSFIDRQIVKRFFLANKSTELPKALYQLLNDFLGGLHNDNFAEIMVSNFSGHQVAGRTDQQMANQLGQPIGQIQLINLLLSAQLLAFLLKGAAKPVTPLLQGLSKPVISASALTTFQLFLKDPTLSYQQIASRRHIKLTTVYEHLLEAAIVLPVADVPFTRLLAPATEQQLAAIAPDQVGNWAYQSLSKRLPGISFFDFRLFQIKRALVSAATGKEDGQNG